MTFANGESLLSVRRKINLSFAGSYTALAADTDYTYTAGGGYSVSSGDVIETNDGGFWEVAASGASDHHATTAGGVKLYEAGPHFSTRARAVAAHDRNVAAGRSVPVGTIWTADGLEYERDSAATMIPDLVGWKPLGVCTPNHFLENITPGTTNMTPGLQGAVDFSSDVSLLGQDYLFSTAVSVTSESIKIKGSGIGITRATCAQGWIDIDNSALTDETSIQVSDLSLISTSAGLYSAISGTGTTSRTLTRAGLLVERVAIHGSATGNSWKRGIYGVQVSDSRINNVSVVGDRDDWSLLDEAIYLSTSVDVTMDGLRLYWGGTGVYVLGDTEGVTLTASHIVGFETGYELLGVNGAAMQNISHCHMNTNQFGIKLGNSDGTASKNSDISHNDLIHNVPSLSGVGGVTDYDWVGVTIDGPATKVTHNTITGSLAQSDKGVVTTNQADRSVIQGNEITGCSTTAVEIVTGCNDCIVSGNTGGSSGSVSDSGTDTRIFGNQQEIFAEEVHGGATVTESNTSVTVSHLLDATPSIRDITVTPTNGMGLATKYYVSAVTSTTFDINLDRTPGAGNNAQFTWWAKLSKANL
ncbi:MAG TPA: hypothetical protein DCG72_06515 [Gammaproteobacteria bacterium]|nr:hypothetical protein [Gammaproteobacteria bacterium]